MFRSARVFYITLVVLLLDQLSKIAVKGFAISSIGIHWQGMEYARSIHVFGDWCKITFIENPNMAFGLDFGGKVLLSVFAILASIGIVIYLLRHTDASPSIRIALALILAGALGNLTDRVFYGVAYGYAPLFFGNVVDFIDFDLFHMNIGSGVFKFWPIFNIADCAVSIGVLLYIFRFKPQPNLSTTTITENGNIRGEEFPVPPSRSSNPSLSGDSPVAS